MRFTIFSILTLLWKITSISAAPAKFERWFPIKSRLTYEFTSSVICASNLSEYKEARRTANLGWLAATCSYQQRCIISNLREDVQARMASASVLLGLTPGLLASLGPSVAEISLLSTQRPFLSLLLSFASPAVYPSRVLKYQSSLEILDERFYDPSFTVLITSKKWQMLMSAVQYILALASIGNVIHTSWQLGDRTTVTFLCLSYYLPLMWTLLPFVVHLPSALAFVRWPHIIEAITADDGRNLLQKETELCMARKQSPRAIVTPTRLSIVLNYVASSLGFVHVASGILVFSSLMFIETVDVVVVISRYMVSTLVSRFILMFELSGMRKVDTKQQAQQQQAQQQQTPHPLKL